jgi:hypothetical protein
MRVRYWAAAMATAIVVLAITAIVVLWSPTIGAIGGHLPLRTFPEVQ